MDNTKDTPIDYKQFEGHTPGPWEVTFPDDDTIEVFHTDDGPGHSHTICIVERTELDIPEGEVLPNAHLLASAPDLLKENQSLKLELQKQKELNAELVAAADILYSELVYESVNGSKRLWGRNGGELAPDRITKLESLIKKSSEI